MKLTKGQQKDLEILKFFIPKYLVSKKEDIEITEEDIKKFFDISERGIKPVQKSIGLELLLEGKRWRNIHVNLYKEGISEKTTTLDEILEGMPNLVAEFLKKELKRK
jgi:hypothetical protein